MKLPRINKIDTQRTMSSTFSGYNRNLEIKDAEFYDMKNMCSDFFPAASPRSKRGTVNIMSKAQGMISKDALAYIDNNKLYYNDSEVAGLVLTDGEKSLVSMGALLCIFPDKVTYNTVNGEIKYLENKYESESNTVTFSLTNISGNDLDVTDVSAVEPSNPKNGDYWLDTSGEKHSLKQWSSTSQMWVSIASTYIKISSPGIGQGFNKFDGVKISGCTAAGTELLNNTSVIWGVNDNYIVVIGILDAVVTQTDSITVFREVPKMDFVIEAGNRLWGCRYGMSGEKSVNEIYASKLGDASNWNCYMGTSTDSYAASLGSDGVFTGAVNYLSYPLFFKENCIHKVYGSFPSNFQIQTTKCRGVQKGSYKSLTIVNERLYYKSPSDVCVYDGSLPQGISEQLGKVRYSDAVSGGASGKYYISMKSQKNEWTLFVYDTVYQFWSKEDSLHPLCFAEHNGELMAISIDETEEKPVYKLLAMKGTEGTAETDFEWMVQSGNIGYAYPDRKYISRFNLRLLMSEGCRVSFFVSYDDGEFIKRADVVSAGNKTHIVQDIPKRCSHMAYRLVGTGDCKIISVTKSLEQGSDL